MSDNTTAAKEAKAICNYLTKEEQKALCEKLCAEAEKTLAADKHAQPVSWPYDYDTADSCASLCAMEVYHAHSGFDKV